MMPYLLISAIESVYANTQTIGTFYESISTNDESSMQVVLNSIHEWTQSNHMLINSKKTKDMLLTFRKSPTTPDSLHLGNCELDRVNVFKLLGVCFQDDLCWNHHIEKMTKKANKRLFQQAPTFLHAKSL